MIQSDDFEPPGIELNRNFGTDLQPERIELDLNVGQIRVKFRYSIFWEMTIKIFSQKIRRKLEILMLTCPSSNQGYDQTTIQLKALQTWILKTETYEKCWPHHCMCMGEEKNMVLLTNPQLQGNQKQKSYRREVQVHDVLKLITLQEYKRELEVESISRANERLGNWMQCFPAREFYFQIS